MLSWSINLFRIRGIRISLHWLFPILLAWAAYEGWQEDGTTGALWSAATIIVFFSCVVLHELGHSLTAMRFGVHVRQILLTPIGGIAQFDQIPRRPSQELLITIAGPLVNFAIAGILWCIVDFPSGWTSDGATESLADFLRVLLRWNLGVGLFNLIPAFPMDGGRILRALLATKLTYLRATFWAATTGKVITLIGFVWELLKGPHADFFVVAICFFIFSAGEAEYQSVKRRETEEALWRESLLRHVSPPPASEPPVL
jgi:Zn-dependent protease